MKVYVCIDSLLLFFSLLLPLMSLRTFDLYIYCDINFSILNLQVFFTVVHQFLWDISVRYSGISSLLCQKEFRQKRFVVTHDSLSKTKLYLLDTRSGIFNILARKSKQSLIKFLHPDMTAAFCWACWNTSCLITSCLASRAAHILNSSFYVSWATQSLFLYRYLSKILLLFIWFIFYP